jgi:very-short-patch-repair endonuclease
MHGSRSSHHALVVAARARAMRHAPTPTEALLFQALRGSRLGVRFNRQVPVGRFIADFAAPSVRLIVEVDGGYHAQRGRADARRDRDLGRLGWRVVHVPAELVTRNLPEAVALIRAAL